MHPFVQNETMEIFCFLGTTIDHTHRKQLREKVGLSDYPSSLHPSGYARDSHFATAVDHESRQGRKPHGGTFCIFPGGGYLSQGLYHPLLSYLARPLIH